MSEGLEVANTDAKKCQLLGGIAPNTKSGKKGHLAERCGFSRGYRAHEGRFLKFGMLQRVLYDSIAGVNSSVQL